MPSARRRETGHAAATPRVFRCTCSLRPSFETECSLGPGCSSWREAPGTPRRQARAGCDMGLPPSFPPWASGVEDWRETGWRSGGLPVRRVRVFQGLSVPSLCRGTAANADGRGEAESSECATGGAPFRDLPPAPSPEICCKRGLERQQGTRTAVLPRCLQLSESPSRCRPAQNPGYRGQPVAWWPSAQGLCRAWPPTPGRWAQGLKSARHGGTPACSCLPQEASGPSGGQMGMKGPGHICSSGRLKISRQGLFPLCGHMWVTRAHRWSLALRGSKFCGDRMQTVSSGLFTRSHCPNTRVIS